AAITEESLPVEKQAGDLVYAGTLNEMGVLEGRATRGGTETTLGQIRRMDEEAQEQEAPIERILNRYAKFYTPAALLHELSSIPVIANSARLIGLREHDEEKWRVEKGQDKRANGI